MSTICWKISIPYTDLIIVGLYERTLICRNIVPRKTTLKIDKTVHTILKDYCNKRGIKMYKFLENLIIEKCKGKPDIYGEN